MPPESQELAFHRGQPRVSHPVSKHATDERQQVQVAGVERRIGAGHAISGNEKRPVEAAAVVRDEPAVPGDVRRQLAEQCGFVGVVRQEKLDLPEPAALPPAETDEEGERARRGGEARRLRVKAEEGSVRRWLAGQRREPPPIHRQQRRGRLDTHERAARRPNELAVEGRGQPLRPDRARPSGGRWRERDGSFARAQARAEVREPPLQANRRKQVRHATTEAGRE